MADFANAEPTKRFFIEMLTRDISLEDAILDLVDNCVDSLVRTRNLKLDHSLLDEKAVARLTAKAKEQGLPHIRIDISEQEFSIKDTCGGITRKDAEEDVFVFGRVAHRDESRLSVFGVGLKRALFKLGRDISVESHTEKDGFRVAFDAKEWEHKPEWRFPLVGLPPAKRVELAGTEIVVKKLTEEARARIREPQLKEKLIIALASTYALVLDRFVVIHVGGTKVAPQPLPIGFMEELKPATKEVSIDGVDLTLLAGLANRVGDDWKQERAGWYVLCNGRVVVSADRSELTGWGGGTAPQFVSKFRGFVGIAFFFSENPEKLPWTTTKRGLNKEGRAYQVAKMQMLLIARPVLSFLNDLYSKESIEDPVQRTLTERVQAMDVKAVLKAAGAQFRPPSMAQQGARLISIQYKVKKTDLDRIRKHLRKMSWSASRVGEHTFEYFLQKECAE
jgi:hypothetical protein